MHGTSVHTVEHLLFLTLLQLIVIVAAARVFGSAARQLGQPRAVGEIVAGLLLGPSLFGALAPETFAAVFRATDGMAVSV
ncbi:MAG: cation:proton antiporter, partial [Sutterellaceae bacterium]|nr:cation:proton antiporter [Burkholderiaceae bacterium]MDW8430932.1 cation:proton antiporter [Sutterellaceae bacterium]